MKYKVGDEVRIKSIDWYNENKNNFGKVWCAQGRIPFDPDMSKYCGKVMTISHVWADHYIMVDDLANYGKDLAEYWTDEMIEGLVREGINIDVAVEETTKDISDKVVDTLMGGLMVGKSFNLPQGYQFKDENGNVINATKIVLEKKKKEYPKTYEECCKVLDYDDRETYCICHTGANERLFDALYCLKVCRDAYWKIAGEEMGLGKPWVPNVNEECFSIARACGEVLLFRGYGNNEVFEFPTPEMRDAFKENFDADLETCKELL